MSALDFLRYFTPIVEANGRFAGAVAAWVVLESSLSVLIDRDEGLSCSEGSVYWLLLLLGGMILGIFGGLGDMSTDLMLRFREDHVCLLAIKDENDEFKPFRTIRSLTSQTSEADMRIGELFFEESSTTSHSRLYLVEEIIGKPRIKADYPIPASGGSVNKQSQQLELDEQQQPLVQDERKEAVAGDATFEDELEKIIVKRYVGTSGTFPTELEAEGSGSMYDGAILRTPQWLMMWSIMRCTTTILFFEFFVYVTSIPLFDTSCTFGERQANGAYIGSAIAGLFVAAAMKVSLPGIPTRRGGGSHKSPEMDDKIAWIWFPAYEEQLPKHVYSERWQGFAAIKTEWKAVFYIYFVLLLGTPFLSLYIWGGFELVHGN